MAQRRGTKTRTKKKSGGQRSSAAARRKRQKAREKQAIKSMLMGAVFIAVLCVFFFVRIGGKTPFNHLFEPEPEVVAPAKAGTSSGTKAARSKAAPARRPPGIKLSPAAKKSAPMEKVTGGEQDSLDDLIKKKSK